jgi:hypothetical protein
MFRLKVYVLVPHPFSRVAKGVAGVNDLVDTYVLVPQSPDVGGDRKGFNVEKESLHR